MGYLLKFRKKSFLISITPLNEINPKRGLKLIFFYGFHRYIVAYAIQTHRAKFHAFNKKGTI